jgi:glycosyltransferase involved in cell wall biosynthesis
MVATHCCDRLSIQQIFQKIRLNLHFSENEPCMNNSIKTIQPAHDIAIIVCTHNPDEAIFSRALESIAKQEISLDFNIECVIVDNNSWVPIEQLLYVQKFLRNCSWAKVIKETQQGLTFARMAGFQATKNSLIVFIDDDNETSPSYLETLVDLFAKYPSVGAWGPGNVNVEFLEDVSDWFNNNFKHVFQERHVKYIEYGCVPETWTSFYPIGTGLAVRREILDRYCSEVEKGNLSSSDRKGKSLSSGGDIQIVWEAIKMGYAAGVSPSLEVKHLIPSNRSNLDYVKRLSFGTASSYLPCLTSSFPEIKSSTVACTPRSVSIIRGVIKRTIKVSIKFRLRLLIIDLASYIGLVSGHYQVLQKNNAIIDFMIQQLKLR